MKIKDYLIAVGTAAAAALAIAPLHWSPGTNWLACCLGCSGYRILA